MKAVEKAAYEKDRPGVVKAKHKKALEEAEEKGKERAKTGRKLPRPNAEKVKKITDVIGKAADKAAAKNAEHKAKANEREAEWQQGKSPGILSNREELGKGKPQRQPKLDGRGRGKGKGKEQQRQHKLDGRGIQVGSYGRKW